MSEIAIKVDGLEKKYKLYKNNKEKIIDLLTPINKGKEFYALKGVSLEIEKGDVVGLVGLNGSGKSTLLDIVSGVLPQTKGEIEAKGKKSILSISSGLKGNLSGRDNIYLKCLMLGFKKEEIEKMEEEIIQFSELGEFIDQPVKTYSSGMKSKLGFSISININPDILIIDEALSVGDKTYAKKCLNKIREFKEKGKTIIIVSHSNDQIKEFCEKVVWMEYGRIKEVGEAKKVIENYEKFVEEFNSWDEEKRNAYRKEKQFNYEQAK